MASFDTLLAGLHEDGTQISTQDSDSGTIVVTSKRIFEVPKDYDTVLAYAGDVNSQIVTFELPLTHEGHELSKCTYKKIKWKNLNSGAEGMSDLRLPVAAEKANEENPEEVITPTTTWKATWEVPPQVMTHAGMIDVAISLYDITNESTIGFSWNTAVYKGFSIGESFVEVGSYWNTGKLPAKNEILVINVDTRTIVMPLGYNTVVANYGDIGTSKVFFQIPKIVRGIDISDENTEVYITFAFDTEIAADFPITDKSVMFNNGEKILLTWNIPSVITCNKDEIIGNFAISIKLQKRNTEGKIIHRWMSSTLSKLSIGPSLATQDMASYTARDEAVDIIDNYFDNREFEIYGNELVAEHSLENDEEASFPEIAIYPEVDRYINEHTFEIDGNIQ